MNCSVLPPRFRGSDPAAAGNSGKASGELAGSPHDPVPLARATAASTYSPRPPFRGGRG